MTSDDVQSDDSQTLVTRRDAMATGGTVAATALLSKFGMQPAAAQTDNEPRINLGDNFYIDDVDADTLAIKDASEGSTVLEYDATAGQWSTESVSTGELSITGGLAQFQVQGRVVPVSPSLGVGDSRSVTESAPITDAIQDIKSQGEGGFVVLPNGTITNSAVIDMEQGISVLNPAQAMGSLDAREESCVVEIPDSTIDSGIRFADDYSAGVLGGFRLLGPGVGTTSGPAIRFDMTAAGSTNDRLFNTTFLPMRIEDWGAQAMVQDSGTIFQNHFTHMLAHDCDAGDKGAVFDFLEGEWNVWDQVGANPRDTRTGSDSDIFKTGDGRHIIRYLYCGGNAHRLVRQFSDDSGIHIGFAQYEPSQQNAGPQGVFTTAGKSSFRCDGVDLASGSPDNIHNVVEYAANNSLPANKYMGPLVRLRSDASVGQVATIESDTAAVNKETNPIIFEGASSNLSNNSGVTLSQPVVCLGDLTKVS